MAKVGIATFARANIPLTKLNSAQLCKLNPQTSLAWTSLQMDLAELRASIHVLVPQAVEIVELLSIVGMSLVPALTHLERRLPC